MLIETQRLIIRDLQAEDEAPFVKRSWDYIFYRSTIQK